MGNSRDSRLYSSQVSMIATSGDSSGITCWLTIIMATFVSEAFEELKKQLKSLGLDEKSKSKFLMEEWRKMRKAEAEEKRAEREAAAEERSLYGRARGYGGRKEGRARGGRGPSKRRKRRGLSVKQKENCSLCAKQNREKPPWNWNC